jgi:hypothetical protein
VRISGAEIPRGEIEADREGNRLDGGDSHQTSQRVLAEHGGHIVQTSERNPIVNQQKENLETLESQQDFV